MIILEPWIYVISSRFEVDPSKIKVAKSLPCPSDVKTLDVFVQKCVVLKGLSIFYLGIFLMI